MTKLLLYAITRDPSYNNNTQPFRLKQQQETIQRTAMKLDDPASSHLIRCQFDDRLRLVVVHPN
jgi:hypothetical protein